MVSSSFNEGQAPVFNSENYALWLMKMRAYLLAFDLQEVVDTGKDFAPVHDNPIINQIKYHSEKVAKRYKTLSYSHSTITEVIFSKIMFCKTVKQAWDKLRLKFHGSEKSKQQQVFNLKKEFALLRMKETELVKDYIDRFRKIANQITLLGEEITKAGMIEQVLVSLPEKFEVKISSLKDAKDL